VVNPHKWLFTPLDASLLLSRRMDQLRAAFSLVPEYLRTLDRASPVLDYNEYQPQLGRRMRALKLWMQLRWFGLDGLRRRIAFHLDLAADLAGRIDADPDWERLARAVLHGLLRYRGGARRARAGQGSTGASTSNRSWTRSTGRRGSCRNRLGEVHDPVASAPADPRQSTGVGLVDVWRSRDVTVRGTPLFATHARGERDVGADRGPVLLRTRWGPHDELWSPPRNTCRSAREWRRRFLAVVMWSAVPRDGRGLGRAGVDTTVDGRRPGASDGRSRRAVPDQDTFRARSARFALLSRTGCRAGAEARER